MKKTARDIVGKTMSAQIVDDKKNGNMLAHGIEYAWWVILNSPNVCDIGLATITLCNMIDFKSKRIIEEKLKLHGSSINHYSRMYLKRAVMRASIQVK